MKISSIKSFRRAILPASIVAAMAFAGSASAFKVEMDNPDLDVRWDNTFRYNAGWRAQSPTFYQTGSAFTGASESKYIAHMNVGGVSVGFCSNECHNKSVAAAPAERMEMLFGEKAFARGFVVSGSK